VVVVLDPPVDRNGGENGKEEPMKNTAYHQQHTQQSEETQEKVREHVGISMVHDTLILGEPRDDPSCKHCM